MTITTKRAQEIFDATLEYLSAQLTRNPCAACGFTNVSASEIREIRQMLKDNDFEGIKDIDTPSDLRVVDPSDAPFPTPKAAHG